MGRLAPEFCGDIKKVTIMRPERETATGMDFVLQTDNLKKEYKEVQALAGLNMNVPKGSIYGLVGKNGAGKTTLMRLICGLQEPSSGNYSLYGICNESKDIVISHRRMGAVIESPAVYTDMTAEENLRQMYLVLGLPSYDGITELLKLVGLEKAGKKKVRKYSLGMKQRLGIAIALAGDPDFLILDEPINGLDPQGIIEMRNLLLKLNREKQITILISSHVLEELSRLATHYGIMDQGKIVKELSAEELEAACRKSVRMEVSDTSILARVLNNMNLEYQILSELEADVFAKVNVTRLVLALAEENCEVFSMLERSENPESYFISLMGGGDR